MSTLLWPTGPQPARVYWRRRLVVLGIATVVVLVIWFVFSGRGEGEAADTTVQTVPSDQVDEGTPTCAADDLALTVATDARNYLAGQQPLFTITVANRGTSSCAVDVAGREILVTSGSDRIWSSVDCAESTEPRVLLLAPGGEADQTEYTWQRIRSGPGCQDGLPEPRAGTYRVAVRLLGAASEEAVFSLG